MANIIENNSIGEKNNIFRRLSSFKNILLVLLILIFINLLYLDVLILKGESIKTISSPTFTQSGQSESSCSSACVTKINEAVKAFSKPSVLPTVSPIPTKSQNSSVSSSSVKEYYVPFGSGSGNSADWQDVSGLQAYVNSTSYPNIKSVVFEASLHIPTGNETVNVRLYNATDNHPVWNSEVYFNGNTSSVLATSSNVTLDSGNKLYKVQLKTQLQFQAILDQSRLHITTK